ncbi:autotransporter [Opitutaceae bacterium TAV5]|nr:autotransporter [Opitutaceae bacterium TAV5]
MKTKTSSHPAIRAFSPILLGAALLFVPAVTSSAAELVKADNTTDLGAAGAWTDGTAVITGTSSDVLVFDDTLQTNSTFTWTSGNRTARGLRLENPANDIRITISNNSTHTIGADGIDMANATKSLTLIGTNQAFGFIRFSQATNNIIVGSGASLNIQTQITTSSTGTLNFTGAGDININGTNGTIRNNGANFTAVTHAGTGTLTLANANTYTGGTTLTSGNFTLAGTGSLLFDLAKGNQVTGNTTGDVRFDGVFNVAVGDVPFTGDTAWTLVAGTFGDLVYGSGFSLSLTGSVVGSGITLDSSNHYTAGNWSYDTATGALSFAAVPEPGATAAFAGAAMLLAGALLRRRVCRRRSA